MKGFFLLNLILSLLTPTALGLLGEERDLTNTIFQKWDNTERHRGLILSKQSGIVGYSRARDLIAKMESGAVARRLANHCVGLEAVEAGNCTLQEFCDFVETQDESQLSLTCEGNVTSTWTIKATLDQEQCLYLSKGNLEGAASYDATMFNAEIDFCFQIKFVFEYSSFFPIRREETVEITRGASGQYTQIYQVAACDASDLDEFLLNGYCTECSAANLDGSSCNSCTECPDGSRRETSVDCGNISPGFVIGCDAVEEDEFFPFALYTGAFCTYYGAANEICSLDRFCSFVEFGISEDENRAVSCTASGSVSGSWDFNLDFSEYCYYGATRTEAEYDGAVFDSNQGDYCWIERVEYESVGDNPVSVLYSRTFTRPVAAVGTFTVRVPLTDECGDEGGDDNIFFPSVCEVEDVCPEVFIGGTLCTSPCVNCTQEGLEPSCTNVHPSLVPDCVEVEGNITYAILEYFASIPETDSPTGIPTPSASTVRETATALVGIVVATAVATLI